MKTVLTSFLIFLSGMTYAQNTALLERLYDDFSSGCITLDFTYSIDLASSEVKGEGTVTFQGNAYHMSGSGLDIYCDGTDVWMADPAAKEVYIEPVAEGADSFLQNPALLFVGLKDNFNISEVSQRGETDTVFKLVPKTVCGIDECSVQIKKNGDLSYGIFNMSEGQIIKVKVGDIKKSDRKDIASFRPTQSFDSSWMVTDLR